MHALDDSRHLLYCIPK